MKFFIAILVASLSSINFSISMENFQKDIRSKIFHTKNITNSREIIIIDNDENEDKKRKSSDDLNHPNNKKRKTLAELSIKQINRKKEESAEELNKREEVCKNTPRGKVYDDYTPFYLKPKAKKVECSPTQINLAEMSKNGQSATKTEVKTLESPIKSLNKGLSPIPINNPPLFHTSPNNTKEEKAHSISSSNKITPLNMETKEHKPNCKVKHIKGTQEHYDLLQRMLDSANDEILITTQSITRIPPEVYNSLKEAADIGVKIRVVYNHSIDEKVEEFFINHNIRYEQNNIHSKFLIVDGKKIVIGSYNWLDFKNINNESTECSFKISKNDNYINQLRGKTYSEIITNRKSPSVKKYDFLDFSISDSSHILLLTTLHDHEEFLKYSCRDAKQKVEIHSKFVTYKNATARLDNIAKNLKPNVKLFLVIGEFFEKINNFIKQHPLLSKNTKIRLAEDFHRKTLVIDDHTISEGSFNWLSSASSIESAFHNQDSTLVVQGPKAKHIIGDDDSLFR